MINSDGITGTVGHHVLMAVGHQLLKIILRLEVLIGPDSIGKENQLRTFGRISTLLGGIICFCRKFTDVSTIKFVLQHTGVNDIIGFPKDSYFYYKAAWISLQDEIVLHVLPNTWNNDTEANPIQVRVHTNCEYVDLIINNKSVSNGKQKIKPLQYYQYTNVTFETLSLYTILNLGFWFHMIYKIQTNTTYQFRWDWNHSKPFQQK